MCSHLNHLYDNLIAVHLFGNNVNFLHLSFTTVYFTNMCIYGSFVFIVYCDFSMTRAGN